MKTILFVMTAAAMLVGIAAAEARQCQTTCSTLYGQTTCNTSCW